MHLNDQKGSKVTARPALAGLSVDLPSALKPITKVTAGRRVTLRAEQRLAQEIAQPAARWLFSGFCWVQVCLLGDALRIALVLPDGMGFGLRDGRPLMWLAYSAESS